METNKIKSNQDYINEWLLELKNVERRPETTLSQYKININLFVKYLDSIGKNVTEIKMVDIRGFFGSNQWKIKTCQTKQATIRNFYEWMSKEDRYMTKNPLGEGIKFGKEERQPKYFNTEDLREVTNYLKNDREGNFTRDRNFVMFEFMIKSGTRRCEVVGTKIKDLDLNSKVATVKVIRKNNKEQYLPLPNSLRVELKRFIKEYELQLDSYLFTNKRGHQLSLNYLNKYLKEVEKDTGIRSTPHVCRHTYGTNLMDNGANLRETQELMGHASPNTTAIYTHNNKDHLNMVVQNLDK